MSNNSSWFGSDSATRQRFQRATELTVTGAGSELLQSFINRTVQQLTLREFGLQAILPRRAGSGQAEIINRRTAGTTGGEWVADTTSTNFDEVGAYTQVSFTYRSLLTRGKVTRKLQATGRSYADVLALEMSAKAEDFANSLENGIVMGDTAGKCGLPASANIANGFLTLIQGVSSFDMSQCVSATGTSVNGTITLSKLDAAIDLVKGSAQRGDLAIIGSFAGIRQINSQLQSQQQFNNVVEVAAGFRVRTYDGIPLIVSTSMPNTFEFGLGVANVNTITGNSSNGTCLMILNTRYCFLSELTPTTVMPLAKSSSQYDEFDMYWDGAPVLSNTKGGSLLTNIKAD